MKSKLLLIMFLLSSLVSLSQARFFLGIDGGYSRDDIDMKILPTSNPVAIGSSIIYINTPESYTPHAYIGNGYLFNLNLGTQHYFDQNNQFGFRWFFQAGYGRTDLIDKSDKTKYPSYIINLGLGADILFDLLKFNNDSSFGFFAGVMGGGILSL